MDNNFKQLMQQIGSGKKSLGLSYMGLAGQSRRVRLP